MALSMERRTSSAATTKHKLHGLPPRFPDDLHSIKLPALGMVEQDKTIAIRLADTNGRRNAASMLINKMYSWRGYGDNHQLPATSSRITFTAYDKEQLVGTLTLGVDSADGLAADDIFKNEIDTYRRQPGAKVCELTKLAFDADVPSKPLLASFFHIIFIYGQRRHNCTHLFIEVNPRHRRFYQSMLGFEPIGSVKMNKGVEAPAQLMVLRISDIRSQIDRYAGSGPCTNTRSLYPFFFSPCEEQGIYTRLEGAYPVQRQYRGAAYWNAVRKALTAITYQRDRRRQSEVLQALPKNVEILDAH